MKGKQPKKSISIIKKRLIIDCLIAAVIIIGAMIYMYLNGGVLQ